jgi:hypothetical protein
VNLSFSDSRFLKKMDGFGQLADVPEAVVELAQDAPAFEAG